MQYKFNNLMKQKLFPEQVSAINKPSSTEFLPKLKPLKQYSSKYFNLFIDDYIIYYQQIRIINQKLIQIMYLIMIKLI